MRTYLYDGDDASSRYCGGRRCVNTSFTTLLVELKEFKVRVIMARGVGRSAGEGKTEQRRTP